MLSSMMDMMFWNFYGVYENLLGLEDGKDDGLDDGNDDGLKYGFFRD